MTTVSLLGLGNMGFACAKALQISPEVSLTVWNRTLKKAEVFASEFNADYKSSVLESVQAGDFIITCLLDYDVTLHLLQTENLAQAMRDKTLLQLSNGSWGDVNKLAAWADNSSVFYLDGSLMGTPEDVGKPHGGVVVTGPEKLWNTYSDIIKLLGAGTIYTGPDRSAGKVMNVAITGTMGTALIGLIHGAAIVDACGLPVGEFVNVCIDLLEMLKGFWKKTSDNWESGNRDPQVHGTARAELWGHELLHFYRTAQEVGVHGDFISEMVNLFDKIKNSGNSEKDISVLLDILKKSSP